MKKRNVQKKEIISAISREEKVCPAHVGSVVNAFLKKIIENLSEGNRLEFREFGIFEVVVRKQRVGRNPQKASKTIVIPERNMVKFTPGSRMKTMTSLDE